VPARALMPLAASSGAEGTGEIVADLCRGLAGAGDDPALLLVFAAPAVDLAALVDGLRDRFPRAILAGCSTAGEVTMRGYGAGGVVALGFPTARFSVAAREIVSLTGRAISDCVAQVRDLAEAFPHQAGRTRFGVLLVDGLSRQEDRLIAAIDTVLAPLPVIGGSAGDNLDFRDSRVILSEPDSGVGGIAREDSAVLILLETDMAVRDLVFDHFTANETRMVVTGARASDRVVTEINAEPAAEEYARLVGVPLGDLSPFVFASNPLMVRAGGRFHVRAVQGVTPDGGLRLLSAIEVGVVLALGQAQDIAGGLRKLLDELPARPVLTLGFDCILRRLDVQRQGLDHSMAVLFREFRMAGFCTYGEQHHGMHVNQTFVGLAFLPPEDREAA